MQIPGFLTRWQDVLCSSDLSLTAVSLQRFTQRALPRQREPGQDHQGVGRQHGAVLVQHGGTRQLGPRWLFCTHSVYSIALHRSRDYLAPRGEVPAHRLGRQDAASVGYCPPEMSQNPRRPHAFRYITRWDISWGNDNGGGMLNAHLWHSVWIFVGMPLKLLSFRFSQNHAVRSNGLSWPDSESLGM